MLKRPVRHLPGWAFLLSFCALLLATGWTAFRALSQSAAVDGYVRITPADGSAAPSALALFTLRNGSGQLVSEAAVEAVRPVPSGRLFLDQRGSSTGLALVNPGEETVNGQLILRSQGGTVLAERPFSLDPGNHLANFAEEFFELPQNFIGSLSYRAEGGSLAGVTLRQSVSTHDEPILAALPLVSLPAAEPAGAPGILSGDLFFGHVGAGDAGAFSLTTEVILISMSTQPAQGHIDFLTSDGEPFPIDAPAPQGATSSIPFELPADGVFTFRVSRQGPPVQGYAVLHMDAGQTPAGTALFQFRAPSGGLISEAGVAGALGLQRAILFADTAGTQTGVALANPGSQAVTVELRLKDRLGRLFGSRQLHLAAGRHTSAFVDQLFGSLPPGFTGVLEVESPQAIVVVSLKLTANGRNDPILTTLPIVDPDHPPAAGEWILPQVGFGGGITTRLLLLSGGEADSAGDLSFHLSDGSPMTVPLLGELVSESPYQVASGGAIQLRMGNRAVPAEIQLPGVGTSGELALNQGNQRIVRPLIFDDQGELRDDFPIRFLSFDESVATVDTGGEITALNPGFSTLSVEVGDRLEVVTLSVAGLFSAPSAFQIDGLASDPSQRLLLAISQSHVVVQQEDLEAVGTVYAGRQGVAGLADGPRTEALFMEPSQLALDAADGDLFVADRLNHVIRRITAGAGGTVSTLAGNGLPGSQDGTRNQASFREPFGLALDSQGQLWIADSGNHTIRRLNRFTGEVATVAGLAGVPGNRDGVGTSARFASPRGVAFVPEPVAQQLARQSSGTAPPALSVLIADTGNGSIRQVFEDGRVLTLTSSDSPAPAGSAAGGLAPVTVAVDELGNIFFADSNRSNLFALLPGGSTAPVLEEGSLGDPRALAIPLAGQLLSADGAGLTRITFGPPRIDSITPQQVSSQGGDEVAVEGGNFAPGTVVVVAGRIIQGVSLDSTRRLTFELPALNSGLALISVQNRGGIAQSSLLIEPPSLESLPVGFITTVAGGSTFEGEGSDALQAPMLPAALAVDNSGRVLVADSRNNRIRRIDPLSGLTLTVAGTGRNGYSGEGSLATTAELNHPTGILVDPAGNFWIADAYNNLIRRVDGGSGILTTVAGGPDCIEAVEGGPAATACVNLTEVVGMAFNSNPPTIFFSDVDRSTVRAIDLINESISTFAGGGTPPDQVGDGLPANQAAISGPVGLAFGGGNLYIAEYGGHRIRRVNLASYLIDTIAGSGTDGFSGDDGPATTAQLSNPNGLALDLDGNLLVADRGNYRVRKIDLASGTIQTVAGDGNFNEILDGSPARETSLSDPVAVAVDGAGNLFVGDSGLLYVFRVDSRTGTTRRVGGTGQFSTLRDGPAISSTLSFPSGLASDSAGNLYVADDGNLRIRRLSGDSVETYAGGGDPDDELGNGGPALQAEFCSLSGLVADDKGNLYLADVCNQQVRRILVDTGIIENVAGQWRESGFAGDNGPAQQALLNEPSDVAIDLDGNLLIADLENRRIRLVDLQSGIIRTIAGTGDFGSDGDGGPATAARLAEPAAVAADGQGNVYVAQIAQDLERIRRISPEGIISTIAGGGAEFADGLPATESIVYADRIATQGDFLYLIGITVVRRIHLSTLVIETVAGQVYEEGFAGDGGPALEALFDEPRGLTFDPQGNLFVADTSNQRIRVVRGPIQ